MVIPAILKGYVHLPLNKGTAAKEAIELCNMFYNTTLNPHDFADTQVFTNVRGVYTLELITLDGNNVVVVFVNKAMEPAEKEIVNSLANPISRALNSVAWINAPLVVQFPQELLFLDEMQVGDTASADLSYKLATLLTNYQIIGRWVSGTMGELCAGNFVMVSKGHKADPSSPLSFIIKIVAGNKQGNLCLKV